MITHEELYDVKISKHEALYELAYDNDIKNIINSLDDELKQIFENFYCMFEDMSTHGWCDGSEIYGGFTFAQFKRVYMILLSLINQDKNASALQIPLPCNIGDDVWELYQEEDGYCKHRKIKFSDEHIDRYNSTIFLTEIEAIRFSMVNNARNGFAINNIERVNK